MAEYKALAAAKLCAKSQRSAALQFTGDVAQQHQAPVLRRARSCISAVSDKFFCRKFTASIPSCDLTLKNAQKWACEWPTSATAAISRMLCIASVAAPTSSVLQPSEDARMGPMVEPHPMSDRVQKSCVGMP